MCILLFLLFYISFNIFNVVYVVLSDFLAYLCGFSKQQSAFSNVVSLLFMLFGKIFKSIFDVQNNKLYVVL